MSDADILSVFEQLNLATEAERERFLTLERMGNPDPYSFTPEQRPMIVTVGCNSKESAATR